MSTGNFVEVANFYDPEEAYCARGYLAANGIETTLLGEHHLAVEPWLRVGLGGYRMYGHSSEKEAILSLLTSVEHAAEKEKTPNDPVQPLKWKRNWFWLPVAFVSSIPFVPKFGPMPIMILQIILLAIIYLTVTL